MKTREIKEGDTIRYRSPRDPLQEGTMTVKNIIVEFNHTPVLWYTDEEDLNKAGWTYVTDADVIEIVK